MATVVGIFALTLLAAPTGIALPETVRVDLESGTLIEGRRTPLGIEALQLKTLSFRAVKDEVVAFQLLLRLSPGHHPVEIHVQPPSDGGPKLEPRVFLERGIRIDRPSSSAFIHPLGPALYPDALVPAKSIEVSNQRHIVLWVDLFVPRRARSGLHAGQIRIGTQTHAFQVEVLDLEMPWEDIARLGAVNFGSFLEREKRDPRQLTRWMQLAHAHHMSVEFLRPVPEIVDGQIDWRGWAERVGPFVDGTAFTTAEGYVGPRAGLPTTRFILPHTDWWPSTASGDGLPVDGALFSRALAQWERFADEQGWFRRPEATEWVLFINALDEPKSPAAMQSLAAYGALIEDAGLKDRAHVRFRADGAVGQKVRDWPTARILSDLGRVVDDWNVCGATAWIPYAALEARLRAHPDERMMVYASNTAGEPAMPPVVVDSAIAGLRAWGWIVFRYGLGGAMNWEIDARAGCFDDPMCTRDNLNLDAQLIYRGSELGVEGPVPSLRLKALRRGAQDAALLALLRKKDPEAARRIALAVVPAAVGDGQSVRGLGTWPIDPTVYDRARAVILSRLVPGEAPRAIDEIQAPAASSLRQRLGRGLTILGAAIIIWATFRTKRRIRKMRRQNRS